METIRRIRHNSIGADPEAVARRKLADEALSASAAGNPIFRVFCGIYVRADELNELKRRTGRILAILSSHGLKPIAPQHDPIAQDSYIRALPFGFDPNQDERWYARRARLWHLDHIARVIRFWVARSAQAIQAYCISTVVRNRWRTTRCTHTTDERMRTR